MSAASRQRFHLVGAVSAVWSAGLLLGLAGRVTAAEQEGRWPGGEPERGSVAEHGAAPASEDRFYRSVMTGTVVADSDPEGLGRIGVMVPSIRGGETSWWAPIAAIGAGPERGRFFRPAVGDEVLVTFLNGDPGWPVVLGSFWSEGVLPTRPDAPAEPQGTTDRASVEVRHSIRQSIESGREFLVLSGTVVEGRGREKLPRIKVKFPWLPRGDSEPHEHGRAIVVLTPGAGRGTFVLPEVGDEVAVAFLEGDTRRPVLLGALGARGLPRVEEMAPGPPPGEEPWPGGELPPGEGWCCHRGEIFVAPEWDCRDLGGTSFSSPAEAERACGD